MAASVASVATPVWTADAQTQITIDKPTGLAEGDLMIGCFMNDVDAAGQSLSRSGWTAVGGTRSEGNISINALYKIASSTDAAASDFTFDLSASSGYLGGTVLRVTGNTSSGNTTGTGGVSGNASSTSLSIGSLSLTPSNDGALLVMLLAGSGVQTGALSGYAINGTNPSWTEHADFEKTDDLDCRLAVASATQASAAEITTISGTFAATTEDHYGIILSVISQADATGTLTHLATSPTLNSPTGKSGTTGTLTHLSVDPTLNSPSGEALDKVWTNTPKS